jgi:hypothetical protein
MQMKAIPLMLCAVALPLTACGSNQQPGKGNSGTNDASAGDAGAGSETAAVDFPNACTFFSQEELETAVGWELRRGEPKDVSAGSSCEFEVQPAAYAKRTYLNPPLPAAAGFSGVTITVYPAASDTFAQGKTMAGATSKPGLGDDAYSNGPNLLHVRVGGKAFSLRMYTDEPGEAGRAKLDAVMTQLATTAVARLK